MAWTTFDDIVDRWVGAGVPTDETLVQALIQDAETIILAEYPRIQERIDDESLSLDVVKLVVTRMVTRLLRNPEGLSYVQQTTGPFSQARNYSGAAADVWLSADEKALLAPGGKGKAFSLNLAPDMQDPAFDSDIWVEI